MGTLQGFALLHALLVQLGWALSLLLFGRLLLHVMLRRLEIQGG
jgi:ABC-type uncharacterized transport system permease subunit